MTMERITWNEIDFVKVGNATDAVVKTGLTVLRFPQAAQGGCTSVVVVLRPVKAVSSIRRQRQLQ